MIWEYLREEEFKKAVEKSLGVCVVPVGCIEKHGQHLPLGTDVIHETEVARRATDIFRFLKNETISDQYHKEWLEKR